MVWRKARERQWRLSFSGTALLATAVLMFLPGIAHGLPEGWGYELVSPAQTNGIDIVKGLGSLDGDHAWLSALLPLDPNQPTGNGSSFAATRTATGWQVRGLADPNKPGGLSAGLSLAARDSSSTIVASCDFRALICVGPQTFERVSADGTRTLMLATIPSDPLDAEPPDIVDGSSDLSRIIVQIQSGEPALLPEDTHTVGRGLYASNLGTLEFLGYDENGNVLDCGAALASNPPGPTSGTGFEQSGLSTDTHTVIFASPDPTEVDLGNCSGPVRLYARRNGQTVNLSAPGSGNPNPDEGATYVGNSRDGDTVYFVTATQLDPDDTDSFSQLYSYHLPTHTLVRVIPDADIASDFGRPSVQVSTDGSFIYFVSHVAIDGEGTDGANNLFLLHDGTLKLVVAADGFISLGQSMRSQFPSPLTTDGRHLLFFSNAQLTGVDTAGTFQLYGYNAEGAGALICLSCRTDGAPTTNVPTLPAGQTPAYVQSDDGSAVLFETVEQLLPKDINQVRDVYLWRAEGLELISSGRSAQDSLAVGISADGNTAFLTTFERLTSETKQSANKLYAARLGGGFKAVAPTPPCTDDVCQGLPSPFPAQGDIVTRSYRGNGNPTSNPTRLVLSSVTKKQLRALRRSGSLTLGFATTRAGRVRVRIEAYVGHHWIVAARKTVESHRGKTKVTLRLSPRVRRYLSAQGRVRLRITAAHSSGAVDRARLTVGDTEHHQGGTA